jgi:hypothetical protein
VSAYTSFFIQVAEEVFNTRASVFSITEGVSLQYTGGFVRPIRGETDELRMTRLQNMDSQNHFCYMWAIWFFHIFCTGGEEKVKEVIEYIVEGGEGHHPLIRIKRYIWGILNMMFPSNQSMESFIKQSILEDTQLVISDDRVKFLRVFFMYYFRSIWEDCETGIFNMFAVIPCNPEEQRQYKNITQALKFSIDKIVYVIED